MIFKILADLVLVLHFCFILFVLFGASLVFKYPRVIWFHLPIAAYGMLISFFRWVCPLTPLENTFRALAGEQGYETGFIEHYLLPLIYPGDLTSSIAITMGLFVLTLNGLLYGVLFYRNKKQ